MNKRIIVQIGKETIISNLSALCSVEVEKNVQESSILNRRDRAFIKLLQFVVKQGYSVKLLARGNLSLMSITIAAAIVLVTAKHILLLPFCNSAKQ